MMLNNEIQAIAEHCDAMMKLVESMGKRLQRAHEAWPDFQVRPGAAWHTRDETPPDGRVWASDGVGVWLIWGGGKPIPDHATAVKYWTEAYIPAPPTPETIKKANP